MSPPWSTVEKLTEEHDLDSFECGLETVDEWFKVRALKAPHLVATHVCVGPDKRVVGFYALKTIILPVEGLSRAQQKNAMEGQAVGILLCQMGVHRPYQGGGAGKQLLRLAMEDAVANHERSPVQLFVVDAQHDKLVPYYAAAGLQQIPGTLRLVAPIGSVRKALAR